MIVVHTEKPIALDSPDHLVPLGTRQDNSVNRAFNRKLRALLIASPRVLDLGCAGGGMVASFLEDGDFAVGVEGSDYSKARQRAAWADWPGNLVTADITEPFDLKIDFEPVRFNVVTLWEVFEHIVTDKLPILMDNIARHLEPDGLVIASICTVPDVYEGMAMHQTVKPREWWLDMFSSHGWKNNPNVVAFFGDDMVRNVPNSFHVVLTR